MHGRIYLSTAKFQRQNAVISIGISMFGNFGWGTRVEKFPHVDFGPTLPSKFHQSFTNVTTIYAENRNWFDANTCSDICQSFGHIGKKESICKCTFILKKTGLICLKLAATVLESCGCFPRALCQSIAFVCPKRKWKHSSHKQVAQFEISFMSLAQRALDELCTWG